MVSDGGLVNLDRQERMLMHGFDRKEAETGGVTRAIFVPLNEGL